MLEERTEQSIIADQRCPDVQHSIVEVDDRIFDVLLTTYSDRYFLNLSETEGNFTSLVSLPTSSLFVLIPSNYQQIIIK